MPSQLTSLKERVALRFGKNKTDEICRLLYEISRRESIEHGDVLNQALQTISPQSDFETVSFSALKRVLLKRRYPSFSDEELSRIYFAPLRLSDELPKPQEALHAFQPDEVVIARHAKYFPLTERVLNAWPDVPVREIESLAELRKPKKEWLKDFGKKRIAISNEQFDLVKPCPCTANACSCNYHVLNIGYGCPYDCTYCYLQDYQNLPAIVLPADLEPFLNQIDTVLKQKPGFFARIGTGEFADSLALDWLTEYSKTLVPFFKDKPVVLELKTKSACVDNLLPLEHGGRTVIAWSINPARFSREEKGTASVQERLEAAALCEQAGYGTAFHFDPILLEAGWEKDYQDLIRDLFAHVGASLRWISLGTLRFHKDLRSVSEFRHPESKIFLEEQRLDPSDEKIRYASEARISAYHKMIFWVRQFNSKVPVYLCMEPPEIWKSVFEEKPYQGKIDNWITHGSGQSGQMRN